MERALGFLGRKQEWKLLSIQRRTVIKHYVGKGWGRDPTRQAVEYRAVSDQPKRESPACGRFAFIGRCTMHSPKIEGNRIARFQCPTQDIVA